MLDLKQQEFRIYEFGNAEEIRRIYRPAPCQREMSFPGVTLSPNDYDRATRENRIVKSNWAGRSVDRDGSSRHAITRW
jgi:hypothetical protein